MTAGGIAASKPRSRAVAVERKVAYHHGNLRQALLDGGLHLLRTCGIGGLTLRECARLAGVSQAAIRNHFPDKNMLLAGLAARGFEALAQRRSARQRPGADLVGWLSLIIENYVGFAIECPDLFRLMFAFEGLKRSEHPELDAAAQTSYDALRAALDAALKAERIDIGDIDSAVFMLWSGMHGMAMLVIDGQRGPELVRQVSPKERCRQLARLLVGGWRGGPRVDQKAAAR